MFSLLRNCHTMFPSSMYHFTVPPAMCKRDPDSPHLLPAFNVNTIFYFSWLIGVLIVTHGFSNHMSRVAGDVVHLFMCVFCHSYLLFSKMSLHIFFRFLIGLFVLMLSVRVIYLFQILVLCHTCGLHVFSPVCSLSQQTGS